MPILSAEDAKKLAKRVLAMATVEEAEVSLSGGPTAHLRFAANTVTTSGEADDLDISFTAYRGKRHASASANQLDDASLKRMVETAERLAQLAPEDPERMPLLGPQDYEDTPAFVAATAHLSPDARAHDCAKAIREATGRKLVAAGFYINRGRFSALANSKGLFAHSTGSSATFTTTMRTPDGTGSGYAGGNSHDAARVDTGQIAASAAAKAAASQAPKELAPGAYTVVLEPQAVADLMSSFNFGLNARSADEGRSAFAAAGGKNRIGEKMFAPQVTIYTDPQNSVVPGSSYTSDGLPTRKIVFVEEGVLKNLIYTRFWAQKMEKQPTGFPTNLILEGGKASLEDLIKSTERGLLVTRFWYIRPVNPQTMLLTGLTRDGLFLIEKGKVQHPVRNFRFNESPVEMLKQVEMVGPARRAVSSEQGSFPMYVPALKVKAFRFTSLSEAV